MGESHVQVIFYPKNQKKTGFILPILGAFSIEALFLWQLFPIQSVIIIEDRFRHSMKNKKGNWYFLSHNSDFFLAIASLYLTVLTL